MDKQSIPKHIAIIMDGNNRWAKRKGLPTSAGHKKGAIVARKVVNHAKIMGVEYLTLYAFSSENWLRPQKEVDYLMNLLRNYLKKDAKELAKEDVRIKIIGNKTILDLDIQELIKQIEAISQNNKFTLVLAISYGSRDEIREAAASMLRECMEGKINSIDIQPETFDKYLYTYEIPDPDLFIRTGGDIRISNFLLWQLAYSELCFIDVLWPDFSKKDLAQAIEIFSLRERRYGGR